LSIAKPRNVSLIDTLSAGYKALHRRLWVLVIPASLSAYLWFGAPVALGSFGAEVQLAVEDGARVLLGDDLARERWAEGLLASDARVLLAWLNFVPLLAPPPGAAPGGRWGALVIGEPLQILGALAVINLLGLVLSSLYLTVLGEAVRGEGRSLAETVRRAVVVARDIVLYLLTLGGIGLILALPFLAISAIVIVTVPAATLLVLLVWYVALFWAYVYTGFAPEAISVSRAGPLRAIYNSVHIVRRDLAGTLGLLALSYLIVNGLGLVWRQVAGNPAGLAVALLGSAYVGGGLSAARLEYYRSRLARWGGAGAR
jgi:hypothetical protein